jgi:hypothetical protein
MAWKEARDQLPKSQRAALELGVVIGGNLADAVREELAAENAKDNELTEGSGEREKECEEGYPCATAASAFNEVRQVSGCPDGTNVVEWCRDLAALRDNVMGVFGLKAGDKDLSEAVIRCHGDREDLRRRLADKVADSEKTEAWFQKSLDEAARGRDVARGELDVAANKLHAAEKAVKELRDQAEATRAANLPKLCEWEFACKAAGIWNSTESLLEWVKRHNVATTGADREENDALLREHGRLGEKIGDVVRRLATEMREIGAALPPNVNPSVDAIRKLVASNDYAWGRARTFETILSEAWQVAGFTGTPTDVGLAEFPRRLRGVLALDGVGQGGPGAGGDGGPPPATLRVVSSWPLPWPRARYVKTLDVVAGEVRGVARQFGARQDPDDKKWAALLEVQAQTVEALATTFGANDEEVQS